MTNTFDPSSPLLSILLSIPLDKYFFFLKDTYFIKRQKLARLVHNLHNIILWQNNTKKTTQAKENEKQNNQRTINSSAQIGQ
jgi:hypothetical protein